MEELPDHLISPWSVPGEACKFSEVGHALVSKPDRSHRSV